MKTFTSINRMLTKLNVTFDVIEFSDTAISARIKDTSISHNYNPHNAIKTLIIKAKSGFMAIILKGTDTIDKEKLIRIIGKWSIVKKSTLQSKFNMAAGTICPLILSLPTIIDIQITKLQTWSMGAGDIRKGINVATKECLRLLTTRAQIADIAIHNEIQSNSWYSNNENMDPITHLLTRGVDTIYPSREALEKVLRSGKKLKLYQGFDPTGIQLHIGHAVGFRKLAQFQALGHEVIFLIGDGTGQAGDPSGKTRSREKFLTNKELRENGKSYVMQSSKIMQFEGDNPVKILYNSDWLNKLTLVDILDIAGHFTLQQMLERDLYRERLKNKDPLSLREFLYPLLQGYDSVAMNVDLELGGVDQTFNMLAGRQLVKDYVGKEKFVMTVPLLTDSKGTKIGKTEGNVIGLTDAPNEFYAKIMALPDDAIVSCFTLLTDTTQSDIDVMKHDMDSGANPMIYKKKLAYALTEQLNSKKDAESAQNEFKRVIQKGESPKAPYMFTTKKTQWRPIELLIESAVVKSKSEAKRLLSHNAIEWNGNIVHIQDSMITVGDGDIIKIGKKQFIQIRITT